MTRRILAQGDRDGACFLYSVANAYQALTGNAISRKQWTRAIDSIRFKSEDFLSGRGTERLDDSSGDFKELAEDFLSKLPLAKFDISSTKVASQKALSSLITNDQVLIIAIEDGDHWVCLVDSNNSVFHVACSATALEEFDSYNESKTDMFGRYTNRAYSYRNLKLWMDCALILRKSSDP